MRHGSRVLCLALVSMVGASGVTANPASGPLDGAGDRRRIPMALRSAAVGVDAGRAILGESETNTTRVRSPAPEGAPFTTDRGRRDLDANPLWDWGLIADGKSHALSTVTRVGDTETAGWTLAQWAAKLPCVDDLSNEADWAALQCYLDTIGTSGKAHIRIPPGTVTINKAIEGCASITIVGAGVQDVSAIKQTSAGVDVIRFCTDSRVSTGKHGLQVVDLAIECFATEGDCGIGINGDFSQTTTQSFYMSRSEVRPSRGSTKEFAIGLRLKNAADAIVENSRIYGYFRGRFDDGHTCIEEEVTIRRVWHKYEYLSCGYNTTGFKLILNEDGWYEGLRMSKIDFIGTLDHISIENNTANGINQCVFDGLQGEVWRSIIRTTYTSSGRGCNGFVYRNGWHIVTMPTPQTGRISLLRNGFVDLDRFTNGTVEGNTMFYGGGSAAGIGFYAGATSRNISWVNNKLLENGGAPSSWISWHRGSFGMYEANNVFNGVNNPVADPGYSTRAHHVSQSYIEFMSRGNCYLDGGVNFNARRNGRKVTCHGSARGKTSPNGELHVAFPLGFVAPPTSVVASNADGTSCNDPVIVRNITSTSFTAQMSRGAGTSCGSVPVRVDYVASGT